MSVYVDSMMTCLISKRWPWPKSCHLIADTEAELHVFARKLRLKMRWFQECTALNHYDLTEGKRREAVAFGAKEINREEMALRIRAARLAKQEASRG